MPQKPEPKGGPHVEAWRRTRAWATGANGTTGGDAGIPRLTREQAAAVLRYTVRLQRAHVPQEPEPGWFAIALLLCGWSGLGKALRNDLGWRRGIPGAEELDRIWDYTLSVMLAVDTAGVPFAGVTPRPAVDYGVMVEETQREYARRNPGAPLPKPEKLPAAPGPVAPIPTEETTDDSSMLLLVALLLIATME
jgi:hypothetical protein